MTGRLLKVTGLAILLVLLAVFATAWWLTRTEPGARWLWNTATGYVPGNLDGRSLAGSLAGGLELLDLDYRSEAVDVDADRLLLTLDLVLFPKVRVNVRELMAEGVLVRRKETEPEEPGEPILPRLALPFELNVQRLVVANLRVVGSAGDEIVEVRNAEAAGRWHQNIALSQLRVESGGGRIEGNLFLGLSPPHALDLEFGVNHEFAVDEDAIQPLRMTLRAEGTLADLDLDLQAAEPEVSITGSLYRLLDEPAWDVRARAADLQWPLASPSPQVSLRQLDLESSGSIADYSVAADGQVSVVEQDELAFTLAGTGNSEAFDVARLELDGKPLQATASGALRWLEPFAVEVDAEIRRLDPSVLTAEWPAETPVEGVVDAAWSAGRIRVDDLRARVPATGAALDATGVVDVEGGIVDLDLDWRDLQWPLRPPEDAEGLRYESEFGVVRVAGRPESWQFDGRLAFAAGELPQGVFQLAGEGNLDEVRATLEQSDVLGGTAQGDVAFNWRNGGSWSARLQTEGVQVGPLLPDWPGSITGEFSTEGRLSPLELQADIAHLEGTLRDWRFVAEGGLSYAAGDLRADQLELRAGDSYLEVDGRLRSAEGLSFTTGIDSIRRYYADVAGSLQGSGNLSLAEQFPRLRLDLQAQDLLWRDYGLKQLSITDQGVPPEEPVALAAKGQMLSIGTREFDSFSLQLLAAEGSQRLELEVSPAGETISFALEGAFEDAGDLRSGWSGLLQSLRLEAPAVASFTLREPAELYLSPERVSVGRACLAGDAEARLCVEGDWSGGTAINAEAELDSMPVDLVRLLLDTDLELTQTLDGALRYSNTAGPASAAGLLEISAGSIVSPRDQVLQTGAGRLRFDLADGRTLSGELTLPIADASEIAARLRLADINEGRQSPLEGEVRIDLADIRLVAELAPMLDTARGRLDVDVTLAGTLESPDWAGDVLLTDGAVTYAPLGISLADMQLDAHVERGGRIKLASTFKAGEGRAEIRSTSDSLAEGLQLSVNGDNLTLIDVPDLSVIADVDLGIRLQDDRLVVNGGVLVPRARIRPVALTSAQVSESGDVVMLSEAAAETEEPEEDDSPFGIVGTVGLQLGRDVLVTLDVAEARLSGTTAFTWNGPPMPVAHGQYNIAGRFEAYGQVLDIVEGAISFPGVSPADPELRIRAEREIFGNPQVRSAGVLVTGTASEPEIEVYTTPATTEDRAVTLLVTGSDFDYEQGVGAVDVGTYIAPDLYISYGIGLFERTNVISVRYDIGKGFGIKATSGGRAEGVDLSYTIER